MKQRSNVIGTQIIVTKPMIVRICSRITLQYIHQVIKKRNHSAQIKHSAFYGSLVCTCHCLFRTWVKTICKRWWVTKFTIFFKCQTWSTASKSVNIKNTYWTICSFSWITVGIETSREKLSSWWPSFFICSEIDRAKLIAVPFFTINPLAS